MAEVIRMPRLSDTMEEGNIVSWLKKVGDSVKPGDILAEVETDKATMELESYFSGTLLYVSKDSGTVPVDGVIAVIGDKDEDLDAILKSAGVGQTKSSEDNSKIDTPKDDPQSEPVISPSGAKQDSLQEEIKTAALGADRVKASPLARSIAFQAGINIADVSGSGDGGRIIKKDVERYLAEPKSFHAKQVSDLSPSIKTAGDVPVSQMRKTIARRLSESKFSAPHFYLTMEINMDEAVRSRTLINEKADIRISFNDMVVKACALALRKHPNINSSWFGDKITTHAHINIGVAVAVADGLLVPVVMNADHKGLYELNQEIKALAAKAKEKKLTPQEMQGNTFTISNLGMFDIDEFTAIINPPDSCILAVGSIVKKPIVKNNEIVIGNIMKVTLSCDHRVVDGAMGAQFLQTVKQYLENPVSMLL